MTAIPPAQGDVEAAVRRYLAQLAVRYLPLLVGVVALLAAVVLVPSTSPSADAEPAAVGDALADGGPLPDDQSAVDAGTGAAPAEQGAAAPGEQSGSEPAAAPAQGAGSGSGSGTTRTGATGAPRRPAAGSSAAAAAGPAAPRARTGKARTGVTCGSGVRQFTWTPYAPPCVPAFTGSNGGATAHGVTAKTVTLSYRVTQSAQDAAIGAATGSAAPPRDLDYVKDLQTYVRWFNTQFETYGREVVVKTYDGRGDYINEDQGQGGDRAQADAATARGLGAFGDITFQLRGSKPYWTALAQQRVVAWGPLGFPDSYYQDKAPYWWAPTPSGSDTAQWFGNLTCRRLNGLKAVFAPDKTLQVKDRSFGLIHPENPEYVQVADELKRVMKACGAKVTREAKYPINVTQFQSNATNIVTQMRAAGVTTVLCYCDPVIPIFLGNAAKSQDYQPEWVQPYWGDAQARQVDNGDWRGVITDGAPWPARDKDEAYRVFKLASGGKEPVTNAYAVAYVAALQAFLGIQSAGPSLSPALCSAATSRCRTRPASPDGGPSAAAPTPSPRSPRPRCRVRPRLHEQVRRGARRLPRLRRRHLLLLHLSVRLGRAQAAAEVLRTMRRALVVPALVVAWALLRTVAPNGLPVGVLLLGAVLGSLTALTAMGLVLVYRASRVVNFAQAEFGGLATTVAVVLTTGSGLPLWLAMPLGLVAALLTGYLTHEVVVRRLFTAPRLILTVATIGIAQVVAAGQIFLPKVYDQLKPVQTFHLDLPVKVRVGPVLFSADHLAVLVVVPLVLVGLGLFLTRSDTGIAVRAAAEAPERALLLGIPVRRLSLLAWVLAAGLSGLGSLLAAPVLGPQLGIPGGPIALLAPLAAAVIARMDSLPVAFVAGVGIGVGQQAVFWNYPQSSLVDLVLFLVVLGALLLQRRRPSRQDEGALGDHVAVREVRPVPRALRDLPEVQRVRAGGLALLLAVVLGVPLLLSDPLRGLYAYTAIYCVIAVSLVVVTGWSGQISLGHFAFVGLGAATAAALLVHAGADLLLALLAAAFVGGTAAVLVGLPALRIRGLFLAVTTLAFGAPVSTWLLNSAYFPSLTPSTVARPVLLDRFPLDDSLTFAYLCVLAAVVAVALARNLRQSRVGRTVVAVRDNERAAAAFGIEPVRAKLTAFAFSGALAGFAGGLYVIALRGIPFAGFDPVQSLVVFTMVVIGGAASLPGALLGAVYVQGVQYFLTGAAQLLATGVGLLLLLLFVPGGLGQVAFALRDRVARVVGPAHRPVGAVAAGDRRPAARRRRDGARRRAAGRRAGRGGLRPQPGAVRRRPRRPGGRDRSRCSAPTAPGKSSLLQGGLRRCCRPRRRTACSSTARTSLAGPGRPSIARPASR